MSNSGACTPWQSARFGAIREYDSLLLHNKERGIGNKHMMDRDEFCTLINESKSSNFDPYQCMQEMPDKKLNPKQHKRRDENMMYGAWAPMRSARFGALMEYELLLLRNKERGIGNKHMMDLMEFADLIMESNGSFDPYVKMEEMQAAHLGTLDDFSGYDFPAPAAAHDDSTQEISQAFRARLSVSDSDYSSENKRAKQSALNRKKREKKKMKKRMLKQPQDYQQMQQQASFY